MDIFREFYSLSLFLYLESQYMNHAIIQIFAFLFLPVVTGNGSRSGDEAPPFAVQNPF